MIERGGKGGGRRGRRARAQTQGGRRRELVVRTTPLYPSSRAAFHHLYWSLTREESCQALPSQLPVEESGGIPWEVDDQDVRLSLREMGCSFLPPPSPPTSICSLPRLLFRCTDSSPLLCLNMYQPPSLPPSSLLSNTPPPPPPSLLERTTEIQSNGNSAGGSLTSSSSSIRTRSSSKPWVESGTDLFGGIRRLCELLLSSPLLLLLPSSISSSTEGLEKLTQDRSCLGLILQRCVESFGHLDPDVSENCSSYLVGGGKHGDRKPGSLPRRSQVRS